MKLKGTYSSETQYSVGDVVKYTDDVVYRLVYPAKSGTPPHDARYWDRVDPCLSDAVLVALDALDMAESAAVTVVDALNSTDSTKALSAKQGKVLNDKFSDYSKKSDIKDVLTDASTNKPLSANQGKVLKGIIDDVHPDAKTIRLLSSTASSEKIFDITVNDSGELTATEYTPPAGGDI